MAKAAYCVHAGPRGVYADAFRNGEYAAIGWEEIGDLSGVPRGDGGALGAVYDAAYPNDVGRHRAVNVGQSESA